MIIYSISKKDLYSEATKECKISVTNDVDHIPDDTILLSIIHKIVNSRKEFNDESN